MIKPDYENVLDILRSDTTEEEQATSICRFFWAIEKKAVQDYNIVSTFEACMRKPI